MTDFFERNKRKSAWALLLLLLPRARTAVVVLLLVVMFAFLLFGARSMGLQIPWAERLARRLALSSESGGMGMVRLGELAKLLKGSNTTRGFQGLWSGRGVVASYEQRESSIKMVKGMRFDGKNSGDGSDSGYSTFLPKAGRGTQGIPTPEEASKMAEGVHMDHDELLAGLAKNAPEGRGAGSAKSDSMEARKRALDRGHAVSAGEEIHFSGVHGGGSGSTSHLTAFNMSGASGDVSGGRAAPTVVTCSSNSCSRFNLAEAKAFSCAAAPPGTSCAGPMNCPAGRCPTEFASFAGGAPFSGSQAGGLGILTTAGEPVPLTPDAQASLQNEYANASKDQNCTALVTQGNPAVKAANDAYAACCDTVASSHTSCYTSCPSFPFSIFFGCTTNCNTTANAQSQNCESVFMGTYTQVANAQNAACPGSQQAGGFVQNTTWGHQCAQY